MPESNESLLYTGNERVSPFKDYAKPVPRGHVPSHEVILVEDFSMLNAKSIKKTKNISVSFDSRAQEVVNEQNVIVGVCLKR